MKRISELPSTGVIGAGDYLVVVQGGVTKKFDLSGQVTVGTILSSQSVQYTSLQLTGTFSFGQNSDVVLHRDAEAILALRNGTNEQEFRVYNTFTDFSNYERAQIAWSGNQLFIGTTQAGTGISRDLILRVNGAASMYLNTNASNRWRLTSDGHFLAVADNAYDIGASGATRPRNIYAAGFVSATSISSSSFTSIADGIATPQTQAGQARIFVDSSDGDLKVLFGDGTVKLIVSDT